MREMNFFPAKSFALARVHDSRKVDDLEATLAEAAQFARRHTVAAIYRASSGHPAEALSCVELLACLYGAELNVWPSTMGDPDRDRCVLSKGSAAPALYAVAAHFGFCDAREALKLSQLGSPFQGLPNASSLPFVEASTSAYGQGFCVALGMALGLRLKHSSARVYSLLGNADLKSGEVWEAAMCAARNRLDNFCVVVDYNATRYGKGADSAQLEPVAARWRAFDWAVIEIDGHDTGQILAALRRTGSVVGRPQLVIAHTVSGKGVTDWEHSPEQIGEVALTRSGAEEALLELGADMSEIMELLDAEF
jgi:transketolase